MKARRNWSALALSSTVLALSIAAAPKAQANPNRYAEDAARLAQITDWISGTWSFFAALRTGVQFLTGFDGGAQITLGDIRDTVVSALNEVNAKNLAEDVHGLADIFHEVQVETHGVAMNMMATGQDMNNLMTSPFAREYLASRLADLRNQGTALFNKLEPIMRAKSTRENDRLVVAVTPAYTVLVPLVVSSMKLIGEIEPSLKGSQDQLISEKLTTAVQTHFMAAGAYALEARYEPLIRGQLKLWPFGPKIDLGADPWGFFHSPVGSDNDWMFDRPLYSYHHTYNGELNTVPALRFFQYQEIPLVKLALHSLQKIVDAGYSTVEATNVYVYNPNTDPNLSWTKPAFAPFVKGRITHVRQLNW